MGDNASGKTTLAQAFTWCLYGNTDFQNKSMLSLSVANNMAFGDVEEAKVIIELIQKEKEYSRSPSSVIRSYNNSFDSKSDKKIAQLITDIENLDNEIEKINERLVEIEDQKDLAVEKCKELREIIIKNEEGEKLQQDYDKYQAKLRTLEKSKIDMKGQILKSFTENTQQFFSLKIIFNILQLLSNNEKLDKGIPDIHKRTIDFLIKRGYCICGTKLDEGSETHKCLLDILNYIPPNSIGSAINQFVRECGISSKTGFSLFENIENGLRFLRDYDNEYFDVEENIKMLNQRLENIKDISLYKRDLTAYESQIRKLDTEHDTSLIRKSTLESEKTHKETERDQLALRDDNNRNIETYRAYAQYIYTILEKEYMDKEKSTRETLEQEINNIFKNIFNGGISLDLDDTYHINIRINEKFDDSDTSTGQNFTIIFAFISGIIKMAKSLNLKDMISTEPYPLVMDAPLSSFDKKRIEKICTSLPEIAEQIIIFIKDTDGEYAESYMAERIGPRY
jgi:DNA sulfur modification protein DndD